MAAGQLFGGRVDCYILDTGERVIAQAGVVRALRGAEKGDRPEKSDLGRYLARLPKRFAGLTTAPSIEFVLPQGGAMAIGKTPDFFVGVLGAYASALAERELHPRQIAMGKQATGLLCLLAGKALSDMIDEACGIVRSSSIDATERLEKEVALLRAKLEYVDPMGPGTIGKPRAVTYILGPMRSAARKLCAVDDNYTEAHFQRHFRAMEEQLREQLRYPNTTGGGKWENLPIPMFGDAMNRVSSIVERAKRQAARVLAALEARKVQLALPH